MRTVCCIKGCDKPSHKWGMCGGHEYRLMRYGNPLADGTKLPNGLKWEWMREAMLRPTDDCILWPFKLGGGGYGDLFYNGRKIRASRLSCILSHGQPPNSESEAAHSCGKRACINPRHLRWATPSENQMDRVLHGTSNRGVRNPMSKLSEAQARELKSRLGTTTQTALAKEYGVSIAMVSKLAHGRLWAWLD